MFKIWKLDKDSLYNLILDKDKLVSFLENALEKVFIKLKLLE